MNSKSEPEAWIFPGQGIEPRELAAQLERDPIAREAGPWLDEIAAMGFFANLHSLDDEVLRRNEVSALLCTLACVSAARRLQAAGRAPELVSGYSVGLWSAMHVAGMLDFSTLLQVIRTRSALMNEADGAKRGAMLAVMGLKDSQLEELCEQASRENDPVAIANYNCPGQYTLAGTRHAVARVKPLLEQAKAYKIVEVPVQGAWHCSLMKSAVPRFRSFLETVSLKAPLMPVVGNVTGDLLSHEPGVLRDELADHLAAPVRWLAGVRFMLGRGVTCFVETGYGNTLTKFGMFIDRSVVHLSLSQALKARS